MHKTISMKTMQNIRESAQTVDCLKNLVNLGQGDLPELTAELQLALSGVSSQKQQKIQRLLYKLYKNRNWFLEDREECRRSSSVKIA